MPSVAEISRKASVSKSTVSLVLNNRPNVSEATRRRVLQAVDDLKREPPLVLSSQPNILLIYPETFRAGQLFRESLQGIQKRIAEVNGRLTLAVHQPPLQSSHATHVLLHDPSFRPDGVIVVGACIDDPILAEIRRERVPCVLAARQQGPGDVSTVGVDNVAGAREATEYLINLGHRRIAYVGGDPAYDYTGLRRQGYRAALADAGLDADGLEFVGAARQAAAAFLAAPDPATAVLFAGDAWTLEALPIMQAAGLRVPDDLSVIGFDDVSELEQYDPPLSAVAVPRQEIGYWTARVLIDSIREPQVSTIHVTFRPRLVVRASCGPPRRCVT